MLRERAPVDLAARGEGKFVQFDEVRGHQILGQRLEERTPQIEDPAAPVSFGDDEGDQCAQSGVTGIPCFHRDGAHAGDTSDGRFDLTRFDSVAADLELPVETAEELQTSVRKVAGPVTGAIETRARRKGIRDEAIGGEIGTIQVSTGQNGSAEIDLPGHVDGARLQIGIEQVELGSLDGPADARELRPLARWSGQSFRRRHVGLTRSRSGCRG